MVRNIKILDRKFFPKGTLVIEQGTLGNRAYMVESGKVEVFITDPQGNKLVLAELGPDAMFGEMAVMSDGLRTASVRTSEDSVLITISSSELQESMKSSGGVYKRLMRMFSERMRDTNTKLLQKDSALAQIEKSPGNNIRPPITLKDVALHISEAEKTELKKEMLPLLGQIRSTLEKFRPKDTKKD